MIERVYRDWMRGEELKQVGEQTEPLPDFVLKWPAVARQTDDRKKRKTAHLIVWTLQNIWADRGERYRNCKLSNFQATTPAQKAAVATVSQYGEELEANVKAGVGLVLVGPAGTGKDHLMAALFNRAGHCGFRIVWTTGAAMVSEYRDAIGNNRSESDLDRRFTAPDILAISDPAPSTGTLTGFQQTALYRIIDQRYSSLHPIWVTINAANRADADNAIGTPIMDRLLDGAVVVTCNWPSFRKAKS